VGARDVGACACSWGGAFAVKTVRGASAMAGTGLARPLPWTVSSMRLPSLKFLKTFQVAAARSSFKAAADELCITPSAVSHQIKALEEQLGVPLFERGPHSLTLTEAGQHY